MIGGVGPESTIDYYRSIISSYRERVGDSSYPSIVINSIDVNRLLAWMGENRLSEVTEYLIEAFRVLTDAGATFGLISANTPHIVFDEVRRGCAIPLISIVEVTRDEAMRRSMKRVGIFATRFTMQAGFYQHAFAERGIEIVLPTPDEQIYLHSKYIGELLEGEFRPGTREALLQICSRMVREDGIESLILAGTELPLLFQGLASHQVPFLNTTELHVAAAVAELLK
jgi:aspartate racemase